MNLSEQVMGDEAAWELCNYEIQLDRQHIASQVADRIEVGTATITDANWIRAEYGISTKRTERN
jgi:hypothetical protein